MLIQASDKEALKKLKLTYQPVEHDTIHEQLAELVKLRNPARKVESHEYVTLVKDFLQDKHIDDYGVWAYYPWNNNLVHLPEKEDFIEIRTSRNLYKITPEERQVLAGKKIGIVGLSVGQSIALGMAIERICGELRLADFDSIELSNMNRIRTGVHNIGIPKVIVAAREIAEIDPFLQVEIFEEGLTTENMDRFFTGNGRLDAFVEVCDGLDMKVISRFKARELRIPVVMDTNDRGMIDIERFDLEPEREILHGLAGDLNPQKITDLSNEEKVPYVLRMIGADTMSARLKMSMGEIRKTITTWPQLASSVQLGGAITTDVCRRIFLAQLHVSGRFYIDLDELIADR